MEEPTRILIVDDNPNNLFTLRMLLEEHVNAEIVEAESGTEALERLLEKDIHLILLDVQMPGMDGFETASMVLARKKTKHIPIVFLTAAYKSDEFKQKGYEVGAADYLTKPLDTPQLLSRVRTYLRFIEQERRHHRELENRVSERTRELSEANERLQEEIGQREQAQAELHALLDQLEQRVSERTAELTELTGRLREQIEEHKRTEYALEEAREKAEYARGAAEAANLAKNRFLANMSHELRTPLNAIIGYAEMLLEEAEDMGEQEFAADLQNILSSSQHLLALVSDVLDIAKLESGKMQFNVESFSLDSLLAKVTDTIRPLVEKNHNTLELDFNPDELGDMHSDSTKLRQILLNLLGNAAKFTENGHVRLEVKRWRPEQEQTDWLSFAVGDTGIGMEREQVENVFQPFSQADNSSTRKYGGTGLGLTIVRKFTELLGGSVDVESQPGKGSCFYFKLPARL